MGSIGSINMIKIAGPQIPEKAYRVAIIDRTGVDGSGYRKEGKKVPSIVLDTIEGVSTLALANTAADDYAALKGTEVTIIDDLGKTTNNVLILDVTVIRITNIVTSTDPTVNYLVFAQWQVKPTG